MAEEYFPDGSKIEDWFYETKEPLLQNYGHSFCITDYGVKADGKVYTREIQALIEKACETGGVIVVPPGEYITGALFFKKGVHLYLDKGAVLKGSDYISDYEIMQTRIEGECCIYVSALINADNCDGFTIFGKGTLDGNGERAWRAFWMRRKWNPDCSNKDEQRARLIFVSNSKNVTISGVTLQNSQFWTSHFYKCRYVKVLNCRFLSPAEPVKAPSTDAIDIDVCSDVLIKGCYMAVNDDSTVLKGGKGPGAKDSPCNGENARVLIEDCKYGYCHGILTCGSESVHNKNILMRRVEVEKARNFLWLKMRPDTEQMYEHIEIKDAVIGYVNSILCIHPWRQFAKDADIIKSEAQHIKLSNIKAKSAVLMDVEENDREYSLKDFSFEDIEIEEDLRESAFVSMADPD